MPWTPVHSTCINGSLMCPHHECPVRGPWSVWSSCSAPCGGGTMERHRSCEEAPAGVPCQARDTEQRQECNLQPCPGEHLGWRVPLLRPPSQLACIHQGRGTNVRQSLPRDSTSLSVCSPQTAYLARCSEPVPPRARASARTCSLAPSVSRNPASWAAAALDSRYVQMPCPDPVAGAGRCAWGEVGLIITGAYTAPAAAQWHVCAPCCVPLHPDLSAVGADLAP